MGTNPNTGEAFDRCIAFTANGAEQSFTVPTNVANGDIQIKAWGASGASGFFGTYAGHGTYGQGMLTATAGDTYTVIVGEGGAYTQSGAKTGGFGGGGLSGVTGSSFLAGNGGGFSGVHLNDSYFILMAGGGAASISAVADGGSGGIATGFDGAVTRSTTLAIPPAGESCLPGAGKGATQTAGGARGTTGLALDNATDGSALQGGTGGQSQPGQNGGGDSGGGGGGFFGGGGGIGTSVCDDNAGGGGSSFLSPALSDVTTEARAVRTVNDGPATAGPGSTDPHYGQIAGALTPGMAPPPASNGAPFPLATGAPGNDGLVIMQWTEAPPPPIVPLATDVCVNRNVPFSGRPDIWWDHNFRPVLPDDVQENNIPTVINAEPRDFPIAAGPGLTMIAPGGSAATQVNDVDATTLDEARLNGEFLQFEFETQPGFISYIEGWTTFGAASTSNLAIDIATQADFSDAVNIFDGRPSSAGGGFRALDTAAQVLLPNQKYYVRYYFYGFTSGIFDSLGFEISSCGDTGDAALPVAAHRQGAASTHRLGAISPDIDPFTPGNTDATADDITATDDEDGITIPALTQGQSATITAEVTGAGGFLQGWIDFDGSGAFEAGEQIATDLQDGDGDGVIEVPVTVPGNAVTTQTFARFRWSTASGLDATAAAPDGEVEDYAVTIVADPRAGLAPFTCSGDLFQLHGANGQLSRVDLATSSFVNLGTGSGGSIGPAGYRTSDNLVYGLRRIGSGSFDTLVAIDSAGDVAVLGTVDGLPDGSYNVGEFAGDGYLHIRQTGSTTGPVYRIDVDARRVVSTYSLSPAISGSFADFAYSPASDLIYTVPTGSTQLHSIDPNTGATVLIGTVNAAQTGFGAMFADVAGNFLAQDNSTGNVYLIDTGSGDSTFVGQGVGGLTANDGFFCQAATVTLGTDFSDAPVTNNASHTIVPNVLLGTSIDADAGAQLNADATGDDADEGNDDDGVTIPALTQGQSATITAEVAGAGGFLQGWIDFDGSGTFEAGEQVATDLQDGDSDGVIEVPVNVPGNAVTTQTFARFRWSTQSGLDATAAAPDGEVEDYSVTIAEFVDPAVCVVGSPTDGYADFVIDFTDSPSIPDAVDNPEQALGAPDTDGNNNDDNPEQFVSVGDVGSVLTLGFNNNLLTTSGDSAPDFRAHELGSPEAATVLVLPTPATKVLLDAQGLVTPDADGFYALGAFTTTSEFVDFDAVLLNAFAAEQLQFTAIRLASQTTGGGPTPGPDIDAVEALQTVACGAPPADPPPPPPPTAPDTDGDGVPDNIDIDDDNDGILDSDETQAVTLLNGGFETAAGGSNNLTVLSGWTVESGNIDQNSFPLTTEGNLSIDLNGNAPGTISQVVTTVAGEPHRLLFDYGANFFNDRSFIAEVTDEATGNVLVAHTFTTDPVPALLLGEVNFTSTGSQIRIRFISLSVTDPTGGNWLDNVRLEQIIDSDNDGFPNHLDIDVDNDGITDNVEAQATQNYIVPAETFNAQGLDTAYEGTNGLTPVNTDGTDTFDYLDTDSDNDSLLDIAERGDGQGDAATPGDADGDGLLDVFEAATPNDGFDVNDLNYDAGAFQLSDSDADTVTDGFNAAPTAVDFDYRDDVTTAPAQCSIGNISVASVTSTSPITQLNAVIDGNLAGNPRATFSSSASFSADITLELERALSGAIELKLFNDGGTANNGLPGTNPAGIAEFSNIQVFDNAGTLIHTEPGRLIPGFAQGDAGVITPTQDIHLLFQQQLVGAKTIVINGVRSYNGDSDPTTTSQFGVEEVRELQFNCVDPASLTATISGSVFIDANLNDTFDPGESDISRITVNAFVPGPDGEFGTGDDVIIASGETGSPYELTVPPGTYQVQPDPNDPDLPADVRPSITSSDTVTVAAGDVVTQADFGVAPEVTAVPATPIDIPVCNAPENWRELQYNDSGVATVDGLTASFAASLAASPVELTAFNPDTTFFDEAEHTPINAGLGMHNLLYRSGVINSGTLDDTFTLDFTGREVYEVYFHINSLDHIGLELLAAENPGLGWEIVSANDDAQNIAGDPNFFLVDTMETERDRNVNDERLGGDAGRSADGTIRIYKQDGMPLDQLVWHFRQDPVNNPSMEGFQMAMEVCMPLDFSDAPLSGTTLGEASHGFNADIRLGADVTVEAAAFDSANADADTDDGVTLPSLAQGQTATITAEVSGAGGFLQGWIDFDGNGTFDADEQVATNFQDGGTGDVDSADGTITFDAPVPFGSTSNQTFARFRWSTLANLDAIAPAPDGEVEDYGLTIAPPIFSNGQTCPAGTNNLLVNPGFETGDLSGWTTTGTPLGLSNHTGAQSGIDYTDVGVQFSDGISGSLSQTVATGLSNGQIFFDFGWNNGSPGNRSVFTFSVAGIDLLEVDTTDTNNNTDPAVVTFLNGASGTIGGLNFGPNESGFLPITVFLQWDLTAVAVNLPPSVPDAGALTVSYALGTDDIAIDNFGLCGTQSDFSDAPIASFGSASHTIVPGIQLGADISFDQQAFDDANAAADTFDDGVTIPALTQLQTATITADVTGAGGFLQGWIDFDGNGAFDPTEQIAVDYQDGGTGDTDSAAGTISFDVAVPDNATLNQTFARFRWSTTSGLDTTTAAPDGEVEDYAVTIAAFSIPDPNTTDTDGDGIFDIADVDDDNDGILDINESNANTLSYGFAGGVEGSRDRGAPNPLNRDLVFGDTLAFDINFTTPTEVEILTTIGDQSFGRSGTVTIGGVAEPITTSAGQFQTVSHTPAPATSYTVQLNGFDLTVTNIIVMDLDGEILAAFDFGTPTSLLEPGFIRVAPGDSGSILLSEGFIDSDGDRIADHLDIDADNDGITDNVEAQTTQDYVVPNEVVNTSGALIGMDTAYNPTGGLIPVNTDGADEPDYLDADSDNDSALDIAERNDGQPTTAGVDDSDGDGLLDVFENGTLTDGFDVNDLNHDAGVFLLGDADLDTLADGTDAAPTAIDLDYRDDTPARDFSDAPLTGTSYGAASHTINGPVALGATVSADPAAFDTPDADGDADDGVTIPQLGVGQLATFAADVTGAGFLQGWIDFDGNGAFDTTEQIALNLRDDGNGADSTANDGQIDFSVSVPTGATTSPTIARFRWSTLSDLDTTAPAPDGEVEDYALTISPSTIFSGEIPDNPAETCVANWYRWVISGTGAGNAAGTNPLRDGAFALMGTNLGPDLWYGPTRPRDTTDSALSTQLGLESTALHAENPQGGGGGIGEVFYGVITLELEPGTIGTLPLTDFGFLDGHAVSVFDSNGQQLARFPSVSSVQNSNVFYIASRRTNQPAEATAERRLPRWNDVLTFPVPSDGKVFIHVINTDERARMRQSVVYCSQDVSNAPASYGVASHNYNVGLNIGTNKDVDVEPGNIIGAVRGNATATNDDADGSDDQDGVGSFAELLTSDVAYAVDVEVTNQGANATLYGWIDFDNSGTFDDTEFTSIAVPAGTSGEVTLNWSGLTGLVAADTYARFRLTTDTLTASDAALAATDGEVEDHPLTIEPGVIEISGQVFFDNGEGVGATAHDGLRAGEEVVAGDLTVQAIDVATGDVIATAQTSGDGTYLIALSPDQGARETQVRVVAPSNTLLISNNVGAAPSSVDLLNRMFVFTPAVGDTFAGLDFGVVLEPRLTEDRSVTLADGQAVELAHTFTAATALDVSLELGGIVEDVAGAFTVSLFHDADCDGAIGSGESVFSGSLAVEAGDTVCAIARVVATSGAASGIGLAFDVEANGTYAGTSETFALSNSDTVTVGTAGTLVLTKTVCNQTGSTCDLVTGTGFGASNTGAPGDVLVYRIVFEVTGPEPVTDVAVFDDTPPYSSLTATTPGFIEAPVGQTCGLEVPAVPSAGYTGVLEWRCDGSLAAGERGVVSFEVQIDR